MPSPPVFDVEALIAPVPGSSPEGKSVPFPVREKLEKAPKEVDPNQFKADDPQRPSEPQRADWGLILRLAQETLIQTSKDLLTAARLTEAASRAGGFAGLRDGLQLLRRLVTECWDRIYPPIEEEGDIEVRAAAFFWLDDPDRGARFPNTVRLTPLAWTDDESFGWLEWKQTQRGDEDGKPLLSEFERAVARMPREVCQAEVDDLRLALSELDQLTIGLNERMGNAAPGMVGIRQAINDTLGLAEQILSKKGPAPLVAAPVEEVAPAPDESAAPAGGGAAAPAPRPNPINDRASVYQQIAAAAAALRKLEPHSPIPYLLERAVELGALPFPDLMKVLVRSPDVLQSMNRELGIKEEAAD